MTTPHDKSLFEIDDDGVGIEWGSFVTALSCWTFLQAEGVSPTVRSAAQTFNVTDATVQQAVADHYWMFITGPSDDPTKQRLEYEGE